ncbi:MAG: copper amine oxidase N-terminal domain-containing protein, partial [Syntrophomonas sp.]
RVLLNGKELALEPSPFSENGHCMVALRPMLEAMGGQVNWDQERQEATAGWLGRAFIIKAGASAALVNDQNIPLGAEARLQTGRLLVPLRFIAGVCEAELEWDSTTATASLLLPGGDSTR